MIEETVAAESVATPPTEQVPPKSAWSWIGYAMDGTRTHGDLEQFYKDCVKAGRDVRLVLLERNKAEPAPHE